MDHGTGVKIIVQQHCGSGCRICRKHIGMRARIEKPRRDITRMQLAPRIAAGLACNSFQRAPFGRYFVSIIIDDKVVQAVFAVPRPDGSFEGPMLDYLREIGARRRILLLAFAPKAAGTYFRNAAIKVLNGQLVRLVQAQGGRDGTLYLPNVLARCLDPTLPETIAHVHMQALTANRNFIDALGLKPVVMIRNLADMLASFLDMLESDPAARAEGLNCQIPENFTQWDTARKRDFMIDVIAPWYASYFATWKDFAEDASETVCVLQYRDFCRDPADALWTALAHADFVISQEECEMVLAEAWNERAAHRFNRGVAGRGRNYFSSAQWDRLRRLLAYYPQLESWSPDLLGDHGEDFTGPPQSPHNSARPPSTMISAPST
jgi:hypothetical protein